MRFWCWPTVSAPVFGPRVRPRACRVVALRNCLMSRSAIWPKSKRGRATYHSRCCIAWPKHWGSGSNGLFHPTHLMPRASGLRNCFAWPPPEKKDMVLDMLSSEASAMRARRIALIGLRGAGKSTLGARLAEEYGARFVELNDEIEDLSGMRIADLIALYGQEGYRRMENEALTRLAETEDRLVLAVAGGVVSQAGAFSNLLDRFHAIWLKAAPEEHMARVRAQGDERPMAGNPAAMEQLRSILTSREDQYRLAAATLNTSAMTVSDAFDALAGLVVENRFLD